MCSDDGLLRKGFQERDKPLGPCCAFARILMSERLADMEKQRPTERLAYIDKWSKGLLVIKGKALGISIELADTNCAVYETTLSFSICSGCPGYNNAKPRNASVASLSSVSKILVVPRAEPGIVPREAAGDRTVLRQDRFLRRVLEVELTEHERVLILEQNALRVFRLAEAAR